MQSETPHPTISERVLERIKQSKTHMRPKWHFVLAATLAATGGVILALALLYIVSFISFVLHHSGAWYAPQFGLRGVRTFLLAIPWLLIILTLVFVGILEVLVRKFSFAYRRPLLGSVIIIIIVVFIGGLAVARTTLHRNLYVRAEQQRLPFAGDFYRSFARPHMRDVHMGVINEIIAEGFRMTNPFQEVLTIVVTPQTRFPLGTDFGAGDYVVVMGQRDFSTTTIRAFGVRIVDSDSFPMSRHMGPGWQRP